MPGARRRGRSRTTWMNNINTCTGLLVPEEESVRMTEDRDKWRKVRPWCDQPSVLGRLKNRTEQSDQTSELWVYSFEVSAETAFNTYGEHLETAHLLCSHTRVTKVWPHDGVYLIAFRWLLNALLCYNCIVLVNSVNVFLHTGLHESWTFGRIFADATNFPFGMCTLKI